MQSLLLLLLLLLLPLLLLLRLLLLLFLLLLLLLLLLRLPLLLPLLLLLLGVLTRQLRKLQSNTIVGWLDVTYPRTSPTQTEWQPLVTHNLATIRSGTERPGVFAVG